MALSKSTKAFLESMVTDQRFADEIERRLALTTPASPAAALAQLDSLKLGREFQARLADCLTWALADDGHEGRELVRKINGCIGVLQTKAYGFTPAVAASYTGQVAGMTTPVTLTAVVAGAAGNSISLVGTGVDDIAALILAWNGLNPGNTVALSSGIGTQTPDLAAAMDLIGGAPASAASLTADKAAMGSEPMSARTLEVLKSALCSAPAALEIQAAYDAMVAAIQATS